MSSQLWLEIEEDTKSWKNIPCSWIGRINIVKKSMFTQCNLHVYCNPYQNTMDFLQRVGTNHLKICVESEKTPNSQGNIEKETRAGGITMPDIRLYYKLWSSRQCGTGTKTDPWINATE